MPIILPQWGNYFHIVKVGTGPARLEEPVVDRKRLKKEVRECRVGV
jgi:hypothetical protein